MPFIIVIALFSIVCIYAACKSEKSINSGIFLKNGLCIFAILSSISVVVGLCVVKISFLNLLPLSVGATFACLNCLFFLRASNLAQKLVSSTDFEYEKFLDGMKHNLQSIVALIILAVISIIPPEEVDKSAEGVRDFVSAGRPLLTTVVVYSGVATYYEYTKLLAKTVRLRIAWGDVKRPLFFKGFGSLWSSFILQKPDWIVPDANGEWNSMVMKASRTRAYFALYQGVYSLPALVRVNDDKDLTLFANGYPIKTTVYVTPGGIVNLWGDCDPKVNLSIRNGKRIIDVISKYEHNGAWSYSMEVTEKELEVTVSQSAGHFPGTSGSIKIKQRQSLDLERPTIELVGDSRVVERGDLISFKGSVPSDKSS